MFLNYDYRKEAHKFYENAGFIDSVKGFRKVYFKYTGRIFKASN